MIDKDYYILSLDAKLLRLIQKLAISILLLSIIESINVVFADNSRSFEADAPGFQVIVSLIVLGIIAFVAPFLRSDNNDSQ